MESYITEVECSYEDVRQRATEILTSLMENDQGEFSIEQVDDSDDDEIERHYNIRVFPAPEHIIEINPFAALEEARRRHAEWIERMHKTNKLYALERNLKDFPEAKDRIQAQIDQLREELGIS